MAAAAAVFARDGEQATLKAVAQEAGVGIGTLYRRFPTREALVDAVYSVETQRLCDSAARLLREYPPVEALRAWTLRFLDYTATKGGMADVLHDLLTADEARRLDTRVRIQEALRILVEAGQDAGELRADLDHDQVFAALGGFTLVLGRRPAARELGGQLFDLLLDGLAPR